jgi:hypothetical protein
MTWLGCQTTVPPPAPPLVAAPPDARQRHRLVGQALPEPHWNIGNTGLRHQACQRVPYHSDVVERQQHTADEQSRSGRLFPSCPTVLAVQERMGFPLLCTVVRGRLVIRWGGRPTRRVSGAHRQGPVPRPPVPCQRYKLHCSSGQIHLTALQALESMSDGELTGKLAIDAAPFAPTAVISGASTTVESLSSRRDLDGPTLEP